MRKDSDPHPDEAVTILLSELNRGLEQRGGRVQAEIREAQPSDAKQLVAFVHELCEETDIDIALERGEFKITTEQERGLLEKYASSENSIFLVADVDGTIVGVLTCLGRGHAARQHVTSLGVSVARAWRNQGIGNALLEGALEWARSSGVVFRIELNVFARNAAAIHLYKKHGFKVEGSRRKAVLRNDEYLDDLEMAVLL